MKATPPETIKVIVIPKERDNRLISKIHELLIVNMLTRDEANNIFKLYFSDVEKIYNKPKKQYQ